MGFILGSVFLAFLSIITETNGLSVNINPTPALVDAGDNLIVTSTITKTETESWKAFTFYVVNGGIVAACRGAFNTAPAACSDMFGCANGFGFSCNYTHFNLHLNNAQVSMSVGMSIYAQVTITGRPTVNSTSTTIALKIPLQGVSLTPNGTLTKKESETQVFRCFARSLPVASLSWYLSGSILPTPPSPVTTTDTVTSTFTYTAQKEDNGKKISCTAVYESTSFTKDALLNVQYRPIVNISPNNNPLRVLENAKNQQLNCNVTAANPNATSYTWKKDGSTISGVTSTYTIPTVNRSDAGSYTCGATNSVGSSNRSAAIQLKVLYGIEIKNISKQEPEEGTQLQITCSGQSYPATTDSDVTWTKQNNFTFNSTGKQLIIENINRVDSGNYVCSVVIEVVPTFGNPLNITGRTAVEVDVLYRPNVTITPKYPQYNVLENTTNLVLECTVVDAKPAVTSYRWYKDGSKVHTNASFTISRVLRADTGSYTCDATNTVGSSNLSADVKLNVLYGIELNHISKATQTEGNQLNITCSGTSNPMMTETAVRWSKQKNNTFSRVGQQLVIDNVNRLDSGTYVCVVVIELTPSVGEPVNVTGKSPVEVDVSYRPDVTVSPDINPYQVKENTSNLLLTCNVIAANPDATSYRWYKDGIKVSTSAKYNILTVYRYHTGNYTCDATNMVGKSDYSPVLQLDVLYGVSLKLSGTKINIDEAEKWDLLCIGDGNPVPDITCMYAYNNTAVGKQQYNVTSIIVNNANCVDTGIYMCSGNNTIGPSVSQSAEIQVACKPRTYHNVVETDILINGTKESLNISTKFISFPISNMRWSKQLPDGNLTDLDNEFIATTSLSELPYETISTLQKDQLTKEEFGIYLVKATNIHGSFTLKYNIIPKRKPYAPTNLTASCGVTSIQVTWISRFNGGENQTFRMNLVNTKSNKTISKGYIADQGENKIINEESEPVSPNTLYLISLEAENIFGTTNGLDIANCTTKTNEENDQPISAGLVGGITGSLCALLIVILIIGGLYWWRWRQVPGGDKELINRCPKEREDDEEGLKANPLYVTAEEASNVAVGPVYGVVNKLKKNKQNLALDEKNDHGPIYSQVQKSNTQEEKQKEKKERKRPKNADRRKDIELGTVYGNSNKLSKHKSHEELYANAEHAEEQGNGLDSAKVYSPQKNKDGLIYADLDLIPGPIGKKFVIRGLENKNNYAIIDLSKKAEPLPSDDEDEDKENGQVKSHDKEGNE